MQISDIPKVNNVQMFNRAKTESEPAFVRAVESMMVGGALLFGMKIVSVRTCSDDEDKAHGDVVVTLDTGKLDIDDNPITVETVFDVKDQTESNRGRPTYCVSEHEIADISANRGKYANRYFACVEYGRVSDGWKMVPTGGFLCCPAYYLGRIPAPRWIIRKDNTYLIDFETAEGRFYIGTV